MIPSTTILREAAELPLTRGYVVLVDKEDLERLSEFSWHTLSSRREVKYAATAFQSKCMLMHRFLLGAPKGVEVDHINGNGLDNRKFNLRLATRAQNSQNMKFSRANTSGFRGVVWDKRKKKWMAQVCYSVGRIRKKKFLGYFKEKLEAAKAYNEGASNYFGEFANLNKI